MTDKYNDRTPIENILPSNYKLDKNTNDDDIIFNDNQYESINNDSENEEKLLEESNNLKNSEIETLLNEIPDDENNDDNIFNKLKKYIKIILILVLLFFIINNKYVLKLLKNYFGDNLFSNVDNLQTSTYGQFVQGSILGVSYVLITTLLYYVGII
jgi:hypothetical protein